jgi:hypothetical protein
MVSNLIGDQIEKRCHRLGSPPIVQQRSPLGHTEKLNPVPTFLANGRIPIDAAVTRLVNQRRVTKIASLEKHLRCPVEDFAVIT